MSAFVDIIEYIFIVLKYVFYSISWITLNTVKDVLLWTKLKHQNKICAFRVIFRYKFELTDFSSSRDFITTYDECVNLKYLLQENVSLYCITKEDAYFVETDKSVDILKSNTYAFQYIAQFEHAVRVFRVPMSLFLELTDDIGNPKVGVCCILNTGRCGSTVLAQALEQVPGTIIHAEPDSLSNLGHIWKSNAITQTRYERILVAIIRLLCKPYQGTTRVVIKTKACTTCHIEALEKHFSNLKIIFMYRNVMSIISSHLRIPRINKTIKYLRQYIRNSNTFSGLFPLLRRGVYYLECYSLEDCPLLEVADTMNEIELFTYAWASNISTVRKYLYKGGHLLLVTYEELMAERIETLKRIFEEIKVDLRHMSTALEAFNQDSQRGTMFSWTNKGGKEEGIITENDRERANKVLHSFGLPNIMTNVSHLFPQSDQAIFQYAHDYDGDTCSRVN